ncbi:hypothetical protein [Bradyrhizobium japonicum]|uniref:hypothetical protein n=1 Tax=Bradyrhizobium japonicum TaxID=375 RepID=UPI001BAD5939|nr:hypothetical protein [Bradyrhizobium japonicum]MBR0764144.1 hypothetical protein [Bradyrhizobium japonicum]
MIKSFWKLKRTFKLSSQYLASLSLEIDTISHPFSIISELHHGLFEPLIRGFKGQLSTGKIRLGFTNILPGTFCAGELSTRQSHLLLLVHRSPRLAAEIEKLQSKLSLHDIRCQRKGLDYLGKKIGDFYLVQLKHSKLFQYSRRFSRFAKRDLETSNKIASLPKAWQLSFDSILLSSARGETHLPGYVPCCDKDTDTCDCAAYRTTYERLPLPDAVQIYGHHADQDSQQYANEKKGKGQKIIALIHRAKLPSVVAFVERAAA